MIKRAVKYILFLFLGLFTGILVLSVAVLYHSSTQNWIGSKITSFLSAQFKTNISIGHIHYDPFGAITLEHAFFGDQRNDTLFYAERVSFHLGKVKLDSLFFEMKNVQVEKGLCKITTYPDHFFNIDVLLDFARRDTSHSTGPPFHLLMSEVQCRNTRFVLTDLTHAKTEDGFDPFYEVYDHILLNAGNFHIINDSLNLDIRSISCREKGGLVVNKLQSKAILSNRGMYFDQLKIETPYSRIKGNLSMTYPEWGTLAAFIDSVRLQGTLHQSQVDMRDIACFAPVLKDFSRKATVDGTFDGTVSDFGISNLKLAFGSRGRIEGKVNISGLPDAENAFVDARLKKAETDTRDLSYLIGFEMPETMQQLGMIQFTGNFTGFMKDFVAYGEFKTQLGNIQSDINMKLSDTLNASSYSGNLSLDQFELGRLTGAAPHIGKATLDLNVNGKGFDLEHLEADLGADIQQFEAKGYGYESIKLSGELKQKMFTGNLEVLDTNLHLTFGGVIDLNRDVPVYQFQAEIERAFLKNLNLDTANTILTAGVDMNFAIRDIDHNEGYISVNNIEFVKNGKDYRIDHAILQSSQKGAQRILNLQADELTCKINGNVTLSELNESFYGILVQLFPAHYKARAGVHTPQDFQFELHIRNSQTLSSLLMPDLMLEKVDLKGNYRNSEQQVNLTLDVDKARYGKYVIRQMNAQLSTGATEGSFRMQAESLQEDDSVVLGNWKLEADAMPNQIKAGLYMHDTVNHMRSNCTAEANFTEHEIVLQFDSSSLEFRKYPFNISRHGRIVFGETKIDFDRVQFTNGSQSILLNGFYDLDGLHNLKASLTNIDLSIINAFYRKSDVRYGGRSDGEFVLKGSKGINFVDAHLDIQALKLDNDQIGDFFVTSNFNEKQKRFLVYAKSVSGKLKNLEFGGYIETQSWPYNANFNIAFDESPLNSFQAFLKGQLYIYDGTTNARCKLTGKINDLSLSGNVFLNKVKARIEYLKTTYSFETSLSLDKHKIVVNPTNLFDEHGRSAQFMGEVRHRSFSDYELDIRLENMQRFKVLNTTFKDNPMYYGTGYASGKLNIHGPINDIVMDAQLKTEAGTRFIIPLNNNSESENAMLNFINTDTSVKTARLSTQTKLYGFSMNILLDVTPNAEIQILMDPVNEDKISGSGKGTLKMELTRQGQFNIFGGVAIEEGDYNFTAVGVWSRRFILQKGSTILWSGDPLQATLDIKGIYKARKTSIANLLLPNVTEAQYNLAKSQRIPVECLMELKGNMLTPEIKFDLNFPDLSTNLGAENVGLFNNLSWLRSNPDMMNQQVVSLLVFNNFVPMNNSPVAGGNITAGVSNTLSDLVTKQLNKSVEKLIPGLDFNLDVQMSNQQRTQYIFSASQKLFDDRLEVQASYDVVTYNNNFMTQYNIRRDGSLRLRAYQKTTNTTEATYFKNITTQGIGLYYRKEFDQFSDLFRRKQTMNN